MKKQIVIIHGGNVFGTYEDYLSFLWKQEIDFEALREGKKGWKRTLPDFLGEQFEIIAPRMPNSTNAKYIEWKIWFEKLIPFLEKKIVLVGHSLGGIFLAKYLSEHTFPKTVVATFLVAAPFDDATTEESLTDFMLSGNLSGLKRQGGKIFLYQSKDDPLVPFTELQKYQQHLGDAVTRIFEDRGHFDQEEFPELSEDIKSVFT